MSENFLTWTRDQYLNDLIKVPTTQILIIGGGIHGASIARLAALNGLSSVLFERGDYASGTSSRSSKMAHGGLRYLENFDFKQVFEGIKAREEMFDDARHICKPERFLIPVKSRDWWSRLKLGIGLYLYDLMVTKKERRHDWISRKNLTFEGFHKGRADLMGCYSYCDGLMNDSRLVVESVLHARELGSRCLNYVEVVKVTKLPSGKFSVIARDSFTAHEYTITADVVVNCAGPWAPFIGHKDSEPLRSKLRYSAGIHLIFNRPWKNPSLFLPMPGKSRYYFVWPHPGGTMVGTTEREVTDIPAEQYPVESEIEEILERLKRDLPEAGLDRSSLHYAFAGVRTLPLRDDTKGTATLSRKHIWQDQSGVLTLLGGKFTTSSWTAFEGFKIIASMLGYQKELKSLSSVHYPGWGTDDDLTKIRTALINAGVESHTASRIVRRLGVRAHFLLENPERLHMISPRLLKGELELGYYQEQGITIEDLLRRRTEIEYLPGSGLSELEDVSKFLIHAGQSEKFIANEAAQYLTRIKHLYRLMKVQPVSYEGNESNIATAA